MSLSDAASHSTVHLTESNFEVVPVTNRAAESSTKVGVEEPGHARGDGVGQSV